MHLSALACLFVCPGGHLSLEAIIRGDHPCRQTSKQLESIDRCILSVGGFVPSMFYILPVIVYESNIGNVNCMYVSQPLV